MSYHRANDYLRHQQTRGLRCDAARWVRPDAAKFLKPDTDPADVYPALRQQRDARQLKHQRDFAEAIAQEQAVLDAMRQELTEINAAMARRRAERKYSEDQPRVPAGNTGGGQWTSGSSGRPRVYITTNPDSDEAGDGGGGISLPFGDIDFGDIASEIDKIDLFNLKPKKPRSGGVRLAGDPPHRLPPIVVAPGEDGSGTEPGIGHNGGPPLYEPPDIPSIRPEDSTDRTRIQRSIATWLGRAIGLGVAVDIYMGAVNSVEWLRQYQGAIETYRDPPRTYQELSDAVPYKRAGTEVHHVIERTALERLGFGRKEINAPQNRVRIPTLKHYEITSYYSKPNKRFGGLTPREYLADKSIEERFRVGRQALIDVKVLKP